MVSLDFRLFACYVQQRNGGKITTIVMSKSKCGILHGMIIWLIVFVRNEMKVTKNNNVVLVTHRDPGHHCVAGAVSTHHHPYPGFFFMNLCQSALDAGE